MASKDNNEFMIIMGVFSLRKIIVQEGSSCARMPYSSKLPGDKSSDPTNISVCWRNMLKIKVWITYAFEAVRFFLNQQFTYILR